MYPLIRRAAVFVVAACACVFSARAYLPPPLVLGSTNVAEWCAGAHLLVLTNPTGGQMEITLWAEKPVAPCIFWTVGADLRDGTNQVASFTLGTEILDAPYLREMGMNPAGVKAVQRFSLSIATNCLPESTLCISQRNIWADLYSLGPITQDTIVRISDLVTVATNRVAIKGQPLFPRKN